MLSKKTRLELEIVLAKLSAVLNILQGKLIESASDFLDQYHLTDYEKSQNNKIGRRMQGSLRNSRKKINQIKHIIRG